MLCVNRSTRVDVQVILFGSSVAVQNHSVVFITMHLRCSHNVYENRKVLAIMAQDLDAD